MFRSTLLAAAGFAVVSAVVPTARADAPPMPIEVGQFYLAPSLAHARFETPEFKSLRLFVKDSRVNGRGLITLRENKGHLLKYDTDTWDQVPEITFGYGLMETRSRERSDGILRLQGSVRGYDRKIDSKTLEDQKGPTSGYEVSKKNKGNKKTFDVGAWYRLSPIDGSVTNDDGTPTSFLTNLEIASASFKMKERTRSGDLMVYFDTNNRSGWNYSGGIGLHYQYSDQSYGQSFVMGSDFAAIPGVAASSGGDVSYTYDYDIESHEVGVKLDLAISKELSRFFTVHWGGTLLPMYKFGEMDGSQEGLCFTTCDITALPVDVSRGRVEMSDDHDYVAYRVSTNLGASLKLWRLMLSGQVGVHQTNSYYIPVEDEVNGPVKLRSKDAWGYFGRAWVTLLL